MLKFDVDPSSGVSMQEQTRRAIVDGIEIGLIQHGIKLPSSRSLNTDTGVARNTAAAHMINIWLMGI